MGLQHGERDQHVAVAADLDPSLERARRPASARASGFASGRPSRVAGGPGRREARGDQPRGVDLAVGDRGVEVVEPGEPEAREQRAEVHLLERSRARAPSCSSRSSSVRPSSTARARSSLLSHWLDAARARAWSSAILSQSRDGWWLLSVRISTMSPLRSWCVSGTSLPLTRAPTQWWPTSVWIA